MPGYVMHIAIAQEYLRKNKKKYSEDFIKGTIAPDIIKPKSESHYGRSPAYTELSKFLLNNNMDSDYMRGYFLHLVADYLFYNKYLDRIEKNQIHHDYDCINKQLIKKYNVKISDSIKDKVYYKNDEPKIVTLELACRVIDEISELDLKQVEEEARNNSKKWNYFKKLVKEVINMTDAAYQYGAFDILRAKDLNELDRNIQISKERGSELFAVGVYSTDLCKNLGTSEPLKSLEDRMKIMEQVTGVDFVFPVYSLDERVVTRYLKEAYRLYCKNKEKQTEKKKKIYEIGYAPGTYDLFHAGHLENLTIASQYCEKLIVGVKSDELVMEHKHKTPIISDEERMEILRHFKFVYDVYKYHTRDPRMADKWIKAKYGKGIGSVFMGSELKEDFKDIKGIKITYTPRSKEKMKTTSTTAYRTVKLGREKKKTTYTGNAEEGRRLREKAIKERVNTIKLNDTDRSE